MTEAALAKRIDADQVAGEGSLPVTDSQRGLLLIDRVVPVGHLYNVVGTVELDPRLSPETVDAALGCLLAVQPALRLRFAEAPADHAVLAPDAQPLIERRTVDRAAFGAAVEDAVDRLGSQRFELSSGPLVRFAHIVADDATASTLVIAIHHTVFDGFSWRPLLRDLDRLLDGGLGSDLESMQGLRETALKRELAAQTRMAGDPETEARARSWGARLREVPATTLYPRPGRPAETSFSGRRLEWEVNEVTARGVERTCQRLQITPFAFFTAVYGTVLARHAATCEVVIGSPFMARRTIGAFDLCGFFVNTLPIVLEVDWAMPFDAYIGDVVNPAVQHAHAGANVPFSRLVAHCRPDRSTTRNPIFSCMLAMQDSPDALESVRAVRERANGTAKFDLWLGVTPRDGGWLLELEHDVELVPPAVAAGILASLSEAVRHAAGEESRRLGELFGDETQPQTAAPRCVDPPASLDAGIRRSIVRRPTAVAIDDQNGQLTYAELGAAVCELAAGLERLNVGEGDVVGLTLDTLTDTILAILAILRRGAAYLPLDPALPRERLSDMVAQAGCRLVIGGNCLPDVTTLALKGLRGFSESTAPGDEPAPVSAPAYVMFTSGSTGRPKGVRMGQPPLLNLSAWQIAALKMGPGTRFLQYAPLGFDVSFQEIVPTLLSGGTVVTLQPADRRDFPAVVDRVSAGRITHLYLPVAALGPFVERAVRKGANLEELRYVCVSGEQLIVDARIEEFFTVHHPQCTLVNLYGPTETHAVTSHRLSAEDPCWPSHVPIGWPIWGVQAYVVDSTGHLAPLGVAGELYLGGRCPAEGYINAPSLTDARFLPDRFAGESGRMYRTGDQVLRDRSGALIFLGRNDDQVKIRGHRVELGELESATMAAPEVGQAAAVVRGTGEQRELVLFARPAHLDVSALKARLGERLPGYMLPSRIFAVDEIPTDRNGKVHRAVLRQLADERLAAEEADAGPAARAYRNELEREIAELFSGLLGNGEVDPDRSLLDYGAHSLTAFAGLAQIEERYGVAVPFLDFFRSPTVASLAVRLQSALGPVK